MIKLYSHPGCTWRRWRQPVAKLFHHPTDGTYYTRRYEGGFVTRLIHPDGVAFLKGRGVHIGDQIPPYAISALMSRGWLVTTAEAAEQDDIDWSPDWDRVVATPARSRHTRLAGATSAPPTQIPSQAPGIASATPVAFTDFTMPLWGIIAMILSVVALIVLGMTVFS